MGLANSTNSSRIIRLNASNLGVNAELTDVAELLNILIMSGQLNVRTFYDFEESGDSDFDYPVPTVSPPRVPARSSTINLDKSDVKWLTQRSSGLFGKRSLPSPPKNIVKMLNMQKNGMPVTGNFSRGDMRRISNCRIPRHFAKEIDEYPTKAFISIFSDDGSRLLAVSQDRNLHLYDSSTSKYTLIKEEKGKETDWSILDATFTPDGNTVLFSSWSNHIHAWRISENSDGMESTQQKLVIDAEGNRFACFSVTCSYDGVHALAGANDGRIYLYDRRVNRLALRLRAHEEDINAVRFGTYGDDVILSGSDDGLIKVWDRRVLNEESPKVVGLFSGHRDGITFLDMKGDGRHFISNSKDQTVKLWDMRKFSSTKEQHRTRDTLSVPEWDYRWQQVPRKLRCKTPLPEDTSVMTYRGHAVLHTLIRSKFSPITTTGQRYIYVGCASGRVVVYDVLTGEIVHVLTGHKANIRDVSWHPYRPEIVTASWDHFVKMWNSTPHAKNDYEFESETDADVDQVNESESEDEQVPSKRVRRSPRIAARQRRYAETTQASFQQPESDTVIAASYCENADAGPSSM